MGGRPGRARPRTPSGSSSPTKGRASIPRAVPEPIRPEQLDEANGRGLYLIRKLVDAVQFNEQGNSICMILRRP